METKAAFLTEIKKIQIGKTKILEPHEDEIQVRVEFVGLCGSDIHFFEKGCIGNRHVTYPFILGHECAGVVTKTGKGVKDLAEGDLVALEPGIPCGKCEFCKEGRYNICPDIKFMATPPNDGALVQLINYPEYMAFKLPPNVSTLEGALVEPLAVGMHAARQGFVAPGKSVVILGAGCIGLSTLLACRNMGASKILVTDLFDMRLKKALELGADFVINTSKGDLAYDIRLITNGEGFDLVFETAGSNITATQTSYIVRRGGTIVMVGNITGDTAFNFRNLIINEITLKTVFRYRNIYPSAIEEIATERIDVKSIVTNIFKFKETQQAFEQSLYDKKNIVKAVVQI